MSQSTCIGLSLLTGSHSQCNMDYIFASSIINVGLRMVCISYDVSCQWFKRFRIRLPGLPAVLQPPPALLNSLNALVPKFHLQSHEEKCHGPFSFNFCFGSGRTEGEGVERNWAELNGQAPSTAEMTPGHRLETLDDACGWVNWRKTMGLGTAFRHNSHIIAELTSQAISSSVASYQLYQRLGKLVVTILGLPRCSSRNTRNIWPQPEMNWRLGPRTSRGRTRICFLDPVSHNLVIAVLIIMG